MQLLFNETAMLGVWKDFEVNHEQQDSQVSATKPSEIHVYYFAGIKKNPQCMNVLDVQYT